MSAFFLEDGTELSKPLNRRVHSHSSYGARDSGVISISVIEVEYPGFLLLTANVNEDKWAWVMSDYLAAIVAHRVGQGWKIHSLDGSSATLMNK